MQRGLGNLFKDVVSKGERAIVHADFSKCLFIVSIWNILGLISEWWYSCR